MGLCGLDDSAGCLLMMMVMILGLDSDDGLLLGLQSDSDNNAKSVVQG